MKALNIVVCNFLCVAFLVGCGKEVIEHQPTNAKKETIVVPNRVFEEVEQDVEHNLPNFDSYYEEPTEWGERVEGVKTRMKTVEKKIALTFDACGGADEKASFRLYKYICCINFSSIKRSVPL